jgi:antirestriction protein ArdC
MTSKKAEAAKARSQAAMTAVVDTMIEALEAGLADSTGWVAPWAKSTAKAAFNPATGKTYSGANWLVLAMSGLANWATFNQWKTIGGQVRKGSKGTTLFRPMTYKVEDKVTGLTKWASVPGRFSTFTVFPAVMVDGWEAPVENLPAQSDDMVTDIAASYEFVKAVTGKAAMVGGDRAFYSPVGDYIGLPDADRFKSGNGAWSTVCHELTHWTGGERRINRAVKNLFGTEAYALEELVAEMGSAMLMTSMGRVAETREDHLMYLANWLGVIKSHPNALFTAASAASKAATMVLETVAVASTEVAVAA